MVALSAHVCGWNWSAIPFIGPRSRACCSAILATAAGPKDCLMLSAIFAKARLSLPHRILVGHGIRLAAAPVSATRLPAGGYERPPPVSPRTLNPAEKWTAHRACDHGCGSWPLNL